MNWRTIRSVADAKDWLAMTIAWLLPQRVVTWAYVRVVAYATTGKYGWTVVPEIRAMDALKRWTDDHEQRAAARVPEMHERPS